MNNIRAIIIDDEPGANSAMKKLLEHVSPGVEVIAACNNASEAIEAIRVLEPDLVFVDILMPGTNGMEMLKSIPEINFEIIFVTAHNTFMERAFRFSAVDYLLKPVDEELLSDAISRASSRIRNRSANVPVQTLLQNFKQDMRKMKLCIPSLKGFQVEEISDILYCEASNNYTNLHFLNRRMICSSRPIQDYEVMLRDNGFVRIHRSSIINLEHVKEYIKGEGGTVVLSNGTELEVSRRKKEHLMNSMKLFYRL